jgi:hypothetical protein
VLEEISAETVVREECGTDSPFELVVADVAGSSIKTVDRSGLSGVTMVVRASVVVTVSLGFSEIGLIEVLGCSSELGSTVMTEVLGSADLLDDVMCEAMTVAVLVSSTLTIAVPVGVIVVVIVLLATVIVLVVSCSLEELDQPWMTMAVELTACLVIVVVDPATVRVLVIAESLA